MRPSGKAHGGFWSWREHWTPPCNIRELPAQTVAPLILILETNFPAVTKHRSGLHVGFSNVVQIAGRSSEFAGAAGNVGRVANDGKARCRKRPRRGYGTIKVDVVSGFRDPVVLHVEEHGREPVHNRLLWRSQQGCRNRAAQITRSRAQSGVGIHAAKIGDDAAPDVNAVATAGTRLRLGLGRRMAAAVGEECGK